MRVGWMVLVGLLLFPVQLLAEDLYFSQDGGGVGTSCGNSLSAAAFNTAANWGVGAGKVSAGDTVHFCSTITTTLTAQGSGSAGNVITFLFETGAKVSQAKCSTTTGCFNMASKSYLVLDGGTTCGNVNHVHVACNGTIENTANGSGLANSEDSVAIAMYNCSNCEVKNMKIGPVYTHTDPADGIFDHSLTNSIRISGSNISIHNNTIFDSGWAILEQKNTSDTNISIYNNEIYDVDHGWAMACNGGSTGTFAFYGNHVHDYSKWDINSGGFHHDGIHAYGVSCTGITRLSVYNNIFDGAQGTYVTAHLYTEEWSNFTGQLRVFNNVFKYTSATNLPCVWLGKGGTDSIFVNNTFINCSFTLNLYANNVTVNPILKNNLFHSAISSSWYVWDTALGTLTWTDQVNQIDYNYYAKNSSSTPWNGFIFALWKSAGTNRCQGCDQNSSSNLSDTTSLNITTYQIAAGSPPVGAGVNLSSLGITELNSDLYGTVRGAAWDIGAYEFVASDTTPPAAPTGVQVSQPATPRNLHFVGDR